MANLHMHYAGTQAQTQLIRKQTFEDHRGRIFCNLLTYLKQFKGRQQTTVDFSHQQR